MAVTIGSVLGSVLSVGRVVVPLIGKVAGLLGKKKSKIVKVAAKVEVVLARNPKRLTGALVSAIAVAIVAIGELIWPGQTAAVVAFIQEYAGPLLKAFAEKP